MSNAKKRMYHINMRDYKKYGKIILSIFLSLLIVFFVVPIFFTPNKIKNLLSNIKFNPNSLTKLFSLNISFPESNELQPLKQYNETFDFSKTSVTPTVTIFGSENPTPTNRLYPIPSDSIQFHSSPTQIPTNIPNPTKPPKPTKAPDVFPIDPSLARPGTTTDEVFAIAGQKTCVPKEVLRTIASIESGGFFSVVSPKYFLLYNSYNWWNSQFLTEEIRACSGYDFDNGTGAVPADSKFAGYQCPNRTQGTRSYIMGPMQVSELEQSRFGGKAASLLGVKQVDRRVILDAITIVGIISNINVQPSSCTNWSGHDVAKAACGYYGTCGIADGTYYCNTFCRNYKTFGGKADCQSAVNKMGDNCWQ